MITVDTIRRIALSLPRSYEALVGDRIKFKVGRIVYLSLSPDETVLGFAYPKEQRAGLIAAEPAKFHMPVRSDERYNWVRAWLAALDEVELRELVVDAWCMAVPRSVAAQYLARTGQPVDTRPETGQPVSTRPGTGQPVITRPGTGQPVSTRPGTGEPASQTSDTRGESCPA